VSTNTTPPIAPPSAASAEESTPSFLDISPMPEATFPAPLPPAPTPGRTPTVEDPEEARRQKILNSKNPKRTKAMLDHWERFNREGRIRNPKRSKAQIESDKAADETRKTKDTPGRRHGGTPPLAPLPTGNLAPKAPMGLAPMVGMPSLVPVPVPGPGPTLPSLSMYGAHNPYAPQQPPVAGLGQPMPQFAPFPYPGGYGMGHMPGPPPPRDPHHRGV
jgi:hypothetical protein